MKTIWIIIFAIVVLPAVSNCQHVSSAPLARDAAAAAEADSAYQQQQAEIAAERAAKKAQHEQDLRDGYAKWVGDLNQLTSNPTAYFRVVEGETNSISNFEDIKGKVLQVTSDGLLLATPKYEDGNFYYTGPTILLQHYALDVVDDQIIHTIAMPTGRYSYTSVQNSTRTVQKYECGTPVYPSQESLDKAIGEAKTGIAFYENQIKAEAARIKSIKSAAAAKLKEGKAKALKIDQDGADKNDPVGLMMMGQRYRDGDGVDKDLVKAAAYFKRAQEAGFPGADTALSALKSGTESGTESGDTLKTQ